MSLTWTSYSKTIAAWQPRHDRFSAALRRHAIDVLPDDRISAMILDHDALPSLWIQMVAALSEADDLAASAVANRQRTLSISRSNGGSFSIDPWPSVTDLTTSHEKVRMLRHGDATAAKAIDAVLKFSAATTNLGAGAETTKISAMSPGGPDNKKRTFYMPTFISHGLNITNPKTSDMLRTIADFIEAAIPATIEDMRSGGEMVTIIAPPELPIYGAPSIKNGARILARTPAAGLLRLAAAGAAYCGTQKIRFNGSMDNIEGVMIAHHADRDALASAMKAAFAKNDISRA